jgi:hypothetical protein
MFHLAYLFLYLFQLCFSSRQRELARCFRCINLRLRIYSEDFSGNGIHIELIFQHECTDYNMIATILKANIVAAIARIIDAYRCERVIKSGFGIYIFHGISPIKSSI